MNIFWLIAALLLIGALLMLLPPLWRLRADDAPVSAAAANLAVHRDHWLEAERELGAGLIAPDRFAQVRGDIERNWLADSAQAVPAGRFRPARRSAVAMAVLLPAASVLVYLALGEPESIGASARKPPAAAGAQHAVTPEQIQAMATALAERLRSAPADVQGWSMLARSYTALGRYADAVIAYRRASALTPANPTLLADFADVLGMTQGRKLAGEPARLVQQALDADPRHMKALALAGSVAFEANDYAAARGYWERLIAVAPPQSDIARSARGSIAQATQLESASAATRVAAPTGVPTLIGTASPSADDSPPGQRVGSESAAPAATLAGEVRISPTLAARVAPGDTLFVFARAAQGPRMPLAVVRRPIGAWPAAFVLDDSTAMAPQLRLSRFDQVVVGARISRSGNATPQAGDLIGESGMVAPGASGLVLSIDRIQP